MLYDSNSVLLLGNFLSLSVFDSPSLTIILFIRKLYLFVSQYLNISSFSYDESIEEIIYKDVFTSSNSSSSEDENTTAVAYRAYS